MHEADDCRHTEFGHVARHEETGLSAWCLVGNGGMDPFIRAYACSPVVVANAITLSHPFPIPHSAARSRGTCEWRMTCS